MKKVAIAILLISALILSSCASAATTTTPTTTATTTVATTTIATTPPTTAAAPTTTAPTTTAAPTTQATTTPTTTASLANQAITVESTAQNIKITFPASYTAIYGTTQAEIEKSAKANGISQTIFNKDGSFTFVMSKEVYQAMLADFRKSTDAAIAELIKQMSNIKAITYNPTMTVFTVKVVAANFTDALSGVALSFYILGITYQSLSGVDPKSIKVVVNFVDVKTGKLLKTVDSTQMGK